MAGVAKSASSRAASNESRQPIGTMRDFRGGSNASAGQGCWPGASGNPWRRTTSSRLVLRSRTAMVESRWGGHRPILARLSCTPRLDKRISRSILDPDWTVKWK